MGKVWKLFHIKNIWRKTKYKKEETIIAIFDYSIIYLFIHLKIYSLNSYYVPGILPSCSYLVFCLFPPSLHTTWVDHPSSKIGQETNLSLSPFWVLMNKSYYPAIKKFHTGAFALAQTKKQAVYLSTDQHTPYQNPCWTSKYTIKTTKRQAVDLDKIFAKLISD